jgi:EmrB/QacA subfamily drug resistance transporter
MATFSTAVTPPEPPVPATARSSYGHWWITAAIMIGYTTVGLSVTVVNLAFPQIMTSLRADLDQMQWVQTGYMIVTAVMMPSVGWLGSRWGNRQIYLTAFTGYVGGSILCGLAWDVHSLIAFRLLQAVFAGPIFPITQVMLFEAFPENKRGLAMGISSLGFSFGPMVGPVLGGYLMEFASWRTVFYINVPTGIVGIILAYIVLPYPQRREPRNLDVLGMFTMATFLVTFLLAMTQGREEGWDSPYILSLLGIAAVSGVSFIVAELHSQEPFVELRLFRNAVFTMAAVVVFLNTLSFMSTNFVVVLFLQSHLKFTPLQAAWMMLPSAVVVGVLSVFSGRLSDVLPPKILVMFGLALVSICIWQYAYITAWTSVGALTFWLTARGFSRAFTIAPLNRASLSSLDARELRMGSALLSLNRGIAAASSVALVATFYQNRLAQRSIWLYQDQVVLPFGQTEILDSLNGMFISLGDFGQEASIKAMAMLNRLVLEEASLHTYHDTFVWLALLSASGIIPALWMGRRPQQPHQDVPKKTPKALKSA